MEKSPFIKVHSVLRKPGRPVVTAWIRVDTIETVSAADEELTRDGVAGCIDTRVGMIVCTETAEEILAMIAAAEKAAV
jgi:hypothetical protein